MVLDEREIADFLPDDRAQGVHDLMGLRDYLAEENPFYEYIKAGKTEFPRGANMVGALHLRWRTMWALVGIKDFADKFFTEPGPRNVDYGIGNESYKWGMGNPVAYDIWYLFYAGNILLKGINRDEYQTDKEWIDELIEEKIDRFFEAVDSNRPPKIKPLKQPKPEENVDIPLDPNSMWGVMTRGFSGGVTPMDPLTNSEGLTSDWPYAIKEARFETIVKARGGGIYVGTENPKPFKVNDEPYWPSKPGEVDSKTHPPIPAFGPKEPTDEEYVGYIAFPVGPIGVMWQVGFATQTSLDNDCAGIHPVDFSTTVLDGGKLLPPFQLDQTEVPGQLLMEKGYAVKDHTVIELTSERFDDVDNPPLHFWMRYWIRKDNDLFWPGEMVCLVVRPWPLHCWWFQESAPFLYAGTWPETEFYTSGVIRCVLDPWYETGDPPDISKDDDEGYYDPAEDEYDFNVGSKLYVVLCKNEEIIVPSSDWLEYQEGDRVGLLKCVRNEKDDEHVNSMGSAHALTDPNDKNFDWQGLKWFNQEGKDWRKKEMFTREWQIVPVDFFPDSFGLSGGGDDYNMSGGY